MTARTILSLAPQLGMDDATVQSYIQKANGRRRRYVAGSFEAPVLEPIENAKLVEVLEWYHLAILELVSVKGFQANAAWVAEHLAITEDQAQRALNELTEQKVLVQDENGIWKSQISNHSLCSKTFPRVQAVKKDLYGRALEALGENQGSHSSIVVSVSESRYHEAVEKIARFRRELMQFLQEPEEKEKVYQLLVSLSPVSK